ncbi:MAG: DeoR family transcriptional regulator, partial [bacterium]
MRKRNQGGAPFLIGGIILTFLSGGAFMPILIVGLILKSLGVFDDMKSSRRSTHGADTDEERRADKYKLMAIGAEALSIEHMASTVGISYPSCLREVQKIVVSGGFGPDAYINYVDKTLVLGSSARQSTGQTRSKTSTYYASEVGSRVTTRRSSDTLPRAERPAYQPAQPKKAAPAEKPKSVFGAAPGLLMALAIALLFFGLVGMGVAVDELIAQTGSALELLFAGSFLAGGVASLVSSLNMRRRAHRINAYKIVIGARDYISVKELSEVSGVNEKTVRKDLAVMLERGLLTESAYLDHGADLLILKPGSVPEKEAEPEVPEDDEDRY